MLSCLRAVESGDVEALVRARSAGCAWDARVCNAAAMRGHADCLEYALAHGCHWGVDTCTYAAQFGHADCLRIAHAHGGPLVNAVEYVGCNAAHDAVACVRYLHEQGGVFGVAASRNAAMRGHVETLQYFHEQGVPWDESVCDIGTFHGQLACLRYAHEHGCPWDSETTSSAAMAGHLECLRYAHEQGCPWAGDLVGLTEFIVFRHLDLGSPAGEVEARLVCLQYALQHGCPYVAYGTPNNAVTTVVRHLLLPKWRALFRARAVAVYWADQAGRAAYGPGGAGRNRDREAFESDMGIL